MNFTQDWFTANIPNFEFVKKHSSPRHVLEVGCHEGRASCWMLDNMFPPQGRCSLTAVDNFSEELKRTYLDNVAQANRASNVEFTLHHRDSHYALAGMLSREQTYDFIYLDASHEKADVFLDLSLCWRLINRGGFILCDDYGGGAGVKPAVDAFLRTHRESLELPITGYQVGIRKL
jgi:predicted O-methyltransferase YrrM